MKIVFLVYRYWPVVGGVEIYMHRMATALKEMGHEVQVIAGATRPELAESESHEGIKIHRFPATRSPLRSRLWFWKHLNILRDADVVHVSDMQMLEYLWRNVGPLVDRRKVFMTRHGMTYQHPVPEQEKTRAKRSLKLAAGIIHDGAFIEKWLGVKPDLCPDQGLFPPADELTPVPEPPADSAVYVGRVEPDSGIRMYIEAVRIVTQEFGRPFCLNVYGDGTILESLRAKVAEENLPIIFHGRQPNAQDRIVDSCFALIDGRMAMQEAMGRRRLVLAASTDPLKNDYIGTETFSPYLIMTKDSRELAERIVHYIDHPAERAELVERAYSHARTLTWKRTAEAYLGLWREKLKSKKARCSMWELLRTAWALNREPLQRTVLPSV